MSRINIDREMNLHWLHAWAQVCERLGADKADLVWDMVATATARARVGSRLSSAMRMHDHKKGTRAACDCTIQLPCVLDLLNYQAPNGAVVCQRHWTDEALWAAHGAANLAPHMEPCSRCISNLLRYTFSLHSNWS